MYNTYKKKKLRNIDKILYSKFTTIEFHPINVLFGNYATLHDNSELHFYFVTVLHLKFVKLLNSMASYFLLVGDGTEDLKL